MEESRSTNLITKADDTMSAMCQNKQYSDGKDLPIACHVGDVSNEISPTPEHLNYLIQRHGTIGLSPLPSQDPADPLNWPSLQV